MSMTHQPRAVAALSLQVPDRIPCFELAFYETERDFEGRMFHGAHGCPPLNLVPYEEAIAHNARLHVDIARRYDHSLIALTNTARDQYPDFIQGILDTSRAIREIAGDEYLIFCHGDATFEIPMWGMEEFCSTLLEDPDAMHEQAEERLRSVVQDCRGVMAEGGVDGFVLCSDYAFNSGPFLSPPMFEEFVSPYLKRLVEEQRAMGAWVIKHSDGDLMPVLDMIVDAQPHALHSIDPMAGMDIKLIKEQYGDRIALCGNVHCAHMQTGTPEQIRESTEYCLTHAKPGGGYVFSTSNCVFKGMPMESYDLIHGLWMQHRDYSA